MKQQWNQLKAKFESFELRERALIAAALVAVIYLLWDFIVLGPLADAKKVALAQQRIITQNITVSESELSVLQSLGERDPDLKEKRELARLKEKLKNLDEELSSLSVGLIKASELPVMLHQMLSQTDKLQLLSLTTLPVELVELEATNNNIESQEAEDSKSVEDVKVAQLFKHGVQVKLQGDYAATYSFMKFLEQSQWQFYWDSLDYEVKEYPKALVTLTLFTLSGDKGVFDRELGAR